MSIASGSASFSPLSEALLLSSEELSESLSLDEESSSEDVSALISFFDFFTGFGAMTGASFGRSLLFPGPSTHSLKSVVRSGYPVSALFHDIATVTPSTVSLFSASTASSRADSV